MCISIAGNFSVGGSDEMLAHTTETLYLLPFVDKNVVRDILSLFSQARKNTVWGKIFSFYPFSFKLYFPTEHKTKYMYDGVIIRQI